jgi:hypothetical protein
LFAKTANAIGLLPEKRDTGDLQVYYLVQLRYLILGQVRLRGEHAYV